MELTARLLRWGATRPHLLLAVAPGGTGVRLAVERHTRARGWPLADGPADADVLVVCGRPDASLQQAVDTTWQAMPGPRVQVRLAELDDVVDGLARGLVELAEPDAQRADAEQRSTGVQDDDTSEADAEQSSSEHGDMDDGEMDHGDMDMEMDMSLPGGLVMADRAPDRDGLKLDVLHLRLGPVLACWPAGLMLDVVLQGDVVQEATAELCAVPDAGSFWTAAPLAAAHLDSAARLLQLTGWGAAADQAAQLRDATLAGTPASQLQDGLGRLQTRIARSWSLRWGLRGLGVLPAVDAERLGVTGPAARADGDAFDRLSQWLLEAGQALAGDGLPDEGPRGRGLNGRAPSSALVDAVPGLVTGLDVAGARLVVASLDPDVAELAPAVAMVDSDG